MKQRNRNYISQSFSLTKEQLQFLEVYCARATEKLDTRITMSEVIRVLIDNFIEQTNIGPADAEPMLRLSDDI